MEDKKKDQILQKVSDYLDREKWGEGYDTVKLSLTYEVDDPEKAKVDINKRA